MTALNSRLSAAVSTIRIVHAIETGEPLRINSNVMNKGLITNLPEGCCVEVPCLVDKEGIHPCYVGDLPAGRLEPDQH